MKEGHIVSDVSATLYYCGEVHTIGYDHPNFSRTKIALRGGLYKLASELMKPIVMIKKLGYGFSVEGNTVYHDDEPVHNLVCERIIDAIGKEEGNVNHLISFLARLRENPSEQAQAELYKFLEVNKLPISEDGYFIAYKRITSDWKDCYTRTVDNSVGTLVNMLRSQVDDDSSRTCSHGYHVCGFQYLKGFHGSRLVACAVNPRDVVSVPDDYHGSKMRICEYRVLEELPMELIDEGRDVLSEDNRYRNCEEECADAYEDGYEDGYQSGLENNGWG